MLDNPPPLGSTITVKHNGCHSTGRLKRPVFWRQKNDEKDKVILGATTLISAQRIVNHKAFFDELIEVFDIKIPDDWYKVRKKDVYQHGGEKLMKQHYEDSLFKVPLHAVQCCDDLVNRHFCTVCLYQCVNVCVHQLHMEECVIVQVYSSLKYI